jgi:blue copper oxidase
MKNRFPRLSTISFMLIALVGSLLTTPPAQAQTKTRPFQKLHIPEALSGRTFELSLHKARKSFWEGATTDTYAYNKESFWGPTLIFNQGDTVQIHVKNDLEEPTTTHWHGLHIPAIMDGGPHQLIPAGKTWSPSFTVKNNAGTYWYHPHAHETTQKQLTMGAGGLILIKDPVETALKLPRTYGVDDIPLVLTSRRFYPTQQFSHEGDNDKYGDYAFVNGTLDAEVSLPKQFVRLRILNAEIERGYNLGFHDNRTFYVIATDGGLVDKPIPVTRMKLMVGERVEILVDLGTDKVGSSLDLMAYNANQPFGFPGGEPGSGRPNGGYLNNLDFRILHIDVMSPTGQAITQLPATLVKNRFWTEADPTRERNLSITADRPGQPFAFDGQLYKMHTTNQTVKLGSVEKWTIHNNRIFGHTFHIHDVQFKIVARSSGPVEPYEQGWKDTVFVPRDQSVSFIAKFEDFASDTDAFMYHCHMANHEDGGLMGEFLVVEDPASARTIAFREAQEHPLTAQLTIDAERTRQTPAPEFSATDLNGKSLRLTALTATKPLVLFFIELNCPCSRDATPFLDRIAAQYGEAVQVIGVINAKPEEARAWAKTVSCRFPLLADPETQIIRAYGVERSVTTTIVAPGGQIERTYPGYGRSMLADLSDRIARLGQGAVRPIDFSAAPEKLTSGCPFGLIK